MAEEKNGVEWIESVGALHVHSRYSDGTAAVGDILEAARSAGLDHVVLTDHDTLAAKREGWEGRHGAVTLLAATEITPKRQGHVLAMNVRHCEGYAAGHNRATLDAVAAQGGFAIIAHPMGKRKPSLGIHQKPWYDWNHPAVRGMEVWSYLHDWIDGVVWWRLPLAYEFWKHPERRVEGPYRNALRQWDALGRTRRCVGLSGLDCHAKRVPLAGVEIFPYAKMFRCLRNHLFMRRDEWEADAVGALWDTLAEGRAFFSHDILADATGARCAARLPDGRTLQMGEEAPFAAGTVMTLTLPVKAEVRWIVDGRRRLTERTDELAARPAGPGVYRFEAALDGRPWFYANPFYLR